MAGMRAFQEAAAVWAAGGPGEPVRDLAALLPVRTVVLLEGDSDVAAVRALAAGHGRDLAAEGVCVLPMGGAMSVGRYARRLGPSGLGLRLTGLCDVRERPFYARGFAEAGERADGFFVCEADLEDELIRALGTPRVERIIHAEGESRALRTFRRQPAQRDRASHRQLRRFLGTKSGRKIHYGTVLTAALTPDHLPAPLNALLTNL